ncbi:MATE family efflux transporter [Nostoc sp. UHCC 0251]|uniref:MATE family efflux transporter n=1 Tax=Nostoc sp. UHCC 0251 TaxID=3110240 RepID=UPI002B219C82|nr:MATE family efflux transporter [Nostoc sp. UHCC 0251]MEA5627136.1 MATE family efflux transporter [Nostoc sp. UHCC 0251]
MPITLLLYNGGALLLLLGQDANTVALAEIYLRAIAVGFIPGLGFAVLKSFLSALLQPQLVIKINGFRKIFQNILNFTAKAIAL